MFMYVCCVIMPLLYLLLLCHLVRKVKVVGVCQWVVKVVTLFLLLLVIIIIIIVIIFFFPYSFSFPSMTKSGGRGKGWARGQGRWRRPGALSQGREVKPPICLSRSGRPSDMADTAFVTSSRPRITH